MPLKITSTDSISMQGCRFKKSAETTNATPHGEEVVRSIPLVSFGQKTNVGRRGGRWAGGGRDFWNLRGRRLKLGVGIWGISYRMEDGRRVHPATWLVFSDRNRPAEAGLPGVLR